MKIGILTFHSQVNYGAILQAYALQKTLESMGHEVFIIDRWFDESNLQLKGPFTQTSPAVWLKLFLRSVLCLGDFGKLLRHYRTMKFIKQYLRLSPYHFVRWEEMRGKELGLDVIVVGSDQVWTGSEINSDFPSVYLLEGAPKNIPAIAYAASFGMQKTHQSLFSIYQKGLQRFAAISVREKRGVSIVKSFGKTADHVIDPTLLADREIWNDFLQERNKSDKKTLVCYFLTDVTEETFSILEKFARENSCRVEVFVNPFKYDFPHAFSSFCSHLSTTFLHFFSKIRIWQSAEPATFTHSFAHATWILTDSFHGLMFSIIWRRNVRVLYPSSPNARMRFSRIEEVANSMISTRIVFDSVEEAIASLERQIIFNEKEISERRNFSRAWLVDALATIER